MAEEDGSVKAENVYGENWLFGEGFVAIKNARNDDDWRDEGNEFGEEIVWAGAVDVAVVKAAEHDWRESDFDVLPGTFVYCGKEPDDFVVFRDVIKEVGKGAN